MSIKTNEIIYKYVKNCEKFPLSCVIFYHILKKHSFLSKKECFLQYSYYKNKIQSCQTPQNVV